MKASGGKKSEQKLKRILKKQFSNVIDPCPLINSTYWLPLLRHPQLHQQLQHHQHQQQHHRGTAPLHQSAPGPIIIPATTTTATTSTTTTTGSPPSPSHPPSQQQQQSALLSSPQPPPHQQSICEASETGIHCYCYRGCTIRWGSALDRDREIKDGDMAKLSYC